MPTNTCLAPLIAALCISIPCHAATKAPECFPSTKFDDTVTSLPVGFCGHNVDYVIAALRLLPLQKDAYESTAQHVKRVSQLADRPLYGSVKGSDLLAFMAPVTPTYDPGAGHYEIAVPLQLLSDHRWALELSGKQGANGQYIAQNAFGARRRVTKEYGRYVVLQWAGSRYGSKSTFVFVKLPPQEARKLDGHALALLHIGKLTAPFLWTDRAYSSATFNHPTESVSDYTVVGFKPSATWLYDTTTGKIISRSVRLR